MPIVGRQNLLVHRYGGKLAEKHAAILGWRLAMVTCCTICSDSLA